MEAPESMEMYCLSCKTRREIPNPKIGYMDGIHGRRWQMKGKCPECGAIVCKFVKEPTNDDIPFTDFSADSSPITQEGTTESPSEPPGAPQEVSSGRTIFKVVDDVIWLGICQRCLTERRFTGEYFGTRFDGKKVVFALCLDCRTSQILVGAREEEEVALEQPV